MPATRGCSKSSTWKRLLSQFQLFLSFPVLLLFFGQVVLTNMRHLIKAMNELTYCVNGIKSSTPVLVPDVQSTAIIWGESMIFKTEMPPFTACVALFKVTP